jgi:hypothetical protein
MSRFIKEIWPIVILVFVIMFSGCIQAGLDAQTQQTLQNAIDMLNNQPQAWQSTMQNTINTLSTDTSQTTKLVLADVQSTYTDALGTSGAEADCQEQYFGHRLANKLQEILHQYNNSVPGPTIVPVICITNPDHVDAGPNPPQTQLLKYYGYDFMEFSKNDTFTADLEYGSGEIVKQNFGFVDIPQNYEIELNIQGEAQTLASLDRNKGPSVVLRWGHQKVGNDIGQSAIPVLIPPPTPIPPPPPQIVSCGPFGGGGGGSYSESFKTPPIGVLIRAGEYVDSIQMIYSTGPGDRWGGGGGGSYPINLNPGEYIQGIGIRSGQYVDSITIYTNLRTFGPYGGGGGGQQPVCGGPGWQVIGIFGRGGQYVDALGVTLQRR